MCISGFLFCCFVCLIFLIPQARGRCHDPFIARAVTWATGSEGSMMGAGHQMVWGDWQAFCLSPRFWFRPHSFINMQMSCAPNLCRTVSFSCFFLYGLAFSHVFLFCLHHHNLYVCSHFFLYLFPALLSECFSLLFSTINLQQLYLPERLWAPNQTDLSLDKQQETKKKHTPRPQTGSLSIRLCLRLRLEMFYLWCAEPDEHVSRVLFWATLL